MFKTSDYQFHPPSGSSVPGMTEANPYMNYPPDDIRALLETDLDDIERAKAKSALKQWERQYQYPGYPWRKLCFANHLRHIAAALNKMAEIVGPPRNIPYYFDSEVPSGFEEILESIQNVHDNDNMERFDIPRQGERPIRDNEAYLGDFSSPKDPIFNPRTVKPDGDGPDPDGMEVVYPIGGDIESWPEMI